MQPKSCELCRIQHIDERHILRGRDQRVQDAILRDWVGRLIELSVVDVRRSAKVDEIDVLVVCGGIVIAVSFAVSREDKEDRGADEMQLACGDGLALAGLWEGHDPLADKRWSE